MKVLDLFSGIGGFSLGLERAGMETIAFCEIEEYPRKVLSKHWPNVPIYEDVKNVTKERLETDGLGRIDLVCGGFPCQDLSTSGLQAGITGKRSGLWSEYKRIIKEFKPKFVTIENVRNLLSGEKGAWFEKVLSDLYEIGYDAEWHCITAASVGAPHLRDRVWIVAYPNEAQFERGSISSRIQEEHANFSDTCWGQDKPGVVRASNGIPSQMDRLGCLGNAVVPQIPEIIGKAIMGLDEK